MNTIVNDGMGLRARRHKQLRHVSWAAIIICILGVLALIPYTYATIYQCGSPLDGLGLCEFSGIMPWVCIIAILAAYTWVCVIIHELGREGIKGWTYTRISPRYAWACAKLGYKDLEKGHHRLVRRTHRVTSIAVAGMAAYISFQFFEADTLTNLVVAAVAYIIGESLNWKTYSKLVQEAD